MIGRGPPTSLYVTIPLSGKQLTSTGRSANSLIVYLWIYRIMQRLKSTLSIDIEWNWGLATCEQVAS